MGEPLCRFLTAIQGHLCSNPTFPQVHFLEALFWLGCGDMPSQMSWALFCPLALPGRALPGCTAPALCLFSPAHLPGARLGPISQGANFRAGRSLREAASPVSWFCVRRTRDHMGSWCAEALLRSPEEATAPEALKPCLTMLLCSVHTLLSAPFHFFIKCSLSPCCRSGIVLGAQA